MKRWLSWAVKKSLAGCAITVLTLGILSGCQRETFLAEDVWKGAHASLPAKLEQDHCPITAPVTPKTPAPATVDDPDRPARYLNLQEAIAIALENGHVSSRTGGGLGIVDTTLASFSGGPLVPGQTERIRVLALNPALTNAAMEASLARFDTVGYSNITWNNTDNLAQGLTSFQNGQNAQFNTGFLKPLATGGFAAIGLLTSYQNLTTPPTGAFGTLNPLYTSRLVFGFEQPLWKDWGVDINQLIPRLANFTGQSLNPSGSAAIANAFGVRQGQLSSFVDRNTEGIIISRLRFDQQRAEFERNVQNLVVNTEVAYWNLYNKYGQLYTFEENLRIMHVTWQKNYEKYKIGSLPPASYFQILGQYEEVRGDRIRALAEVLNAERNLRGILGLPTEDGTRLIPITPPTLQELKPDWDCCLQDALNLRPELLLARDNLRYQQYLLSIQSNNLKPDLRAFARYEPVGFGNTLTGNGTFADGTGTQRPTNAFRSLAGGNFADYSIGLSLSVPLGYRAELAAIRGARLELTQAFLFLHDQEDKAARYLAEQYAELANFYRRIEANRAERLGYLESLKISLERIRQGQLNFGGNDKEGPFAFLDAQRRYSAALVKEYDSIAQYNATLARLEWAKGTILQYNNVRISEGTLPQCAQVRAVEYEKERSKSLVLRERPDSLHQPGRLCGKNLAPASLNTPLPEETPLPPAKSEPSYEKLPSVPRRLDEKSAPEKQKLPSVPGRLDEKLAPESKQEKQIDFRPAPAALPKLEPVSGPSLLPANTGAILPMSPSSPAWKQASPLSMRRDGVPQGGATGFVTLEGSNTLAFLADPEARTAVLPATLAPTVVRAAIAEPQIVDFPPPARK
jgi:outer membrane protein TolC